MPLVVYSSSAGSGKTTTLVTEYLKIALQNPNSFRNILAITFTNKAANEMKDRVIETLIQLSDASKNIDPKYIDLIYTLGFERNVLRKRADILLSLILHNYDEFAISTIDSFIHRIIRTFATDVQLPQSFEVVIEDDEIIPDIVQNLYQKVGVDKNLTKLLINFVLAEADEENSYDPTSKLVEFIKYHMNEDGFKHISKLNNLTTANMADIINRLNKKIWIEKSNIIKIATESVNLCHGNNLEISDFFSGKSGILGYFVKLMNFQIADDKLFPGKNILKTINEDKWFSSKASAAIQSTISGITSELTSNYNEIISSVTSYFYYRLVYSKIYSLALVNEIRNLFIEYTEQTGKVHISEFNKKISSQIADQPVPFIYERLGRKYRYFLIDEFQDTSILQWYNLLPLIEESLSYGNFNMLVGDAKQAIYRFRSGEVELFANLPDLYKNDGSQLSLEREKLIHREFKKVELSTNWRSYPEIINFNNSFFGDISQTLSEKTKKIYENHTQQIPNNSKSGGLVSINFVQQDDSQLYEAEKLLNIKGFIEQLKSANFQERDICILCRTKKSAISIAGYLIEEKYNVVSSESLLIANSSRVRVIIAFIKLLVFPENELALAEFLDNYFKIYPNIYTFNKAFKDIRKSKVNVIESILSYFGISASYKSLQTLSTYETAEFVIREIICKQDADIFTQYLLDFIFESNLPMELFVDAWDDKKEKLYITMPNDVNAIQIMTIHKAKGLDFLAVIVDAPNLKQRNTKEEYWEDICLKDIEELKVGLLPLTKKLEHINKLDIYEEEVAKTELDFLNVIYVAFTRPVKALFTIGQLKTKHPKDKFTGYLVGYLKNMGLWDDKKMNYTFGHLPKNSKHEDNKNDLKTINLDKFISSKWQELISVSSSEDLNNTTLDNISSQSYGKLIHKILSYVYIEDDILKVTKNLVTSSVLSNADIAIIKDILTQITTHSSLEKYFNNNLIIKNETELMLDNGDILRPDKVVINNGVLTIIDYKTGEENKDDLEQLVGYRNAFIELGYNNVEAKLVYIGDSIKVVDVA